MAILATGNTFADGDQVTSTTLNNIANAATFAADAVDDSTTALSGGKIIIKDSGVTPAKLSTNHPNWDATGLGVGTSSPSSKLDVETSSSSADGIDINNTSTGDPVLEFQLAGTSKFVMGVDNSDSDKFKIGTTAVETSTCLTIDSTGPKLTIGSGAAADTAIIFDGNAQDFYIGLDDSADDLLIGLGSTIGTTPAISIDENLKSTFGGDVVIGGTTPTLTIGDAGAEDTAIVFDGNAQDFYIGLDDSADDLIIGVGDTVGTTPAISVTDGRAVTLNTSLTLASGATVTAVLDEDNMASDSATSLATQQSIKAYVDAQVDTADSLSEILAIGNTSGGTDIVLSTTDKTQFRDAAIYIHSSTDGQLDIVADTEIQIAATTIDINGAVALNGAITGATNITLSGELDAATLDISGNADIDGTTNLDIVDIDGAVDMATTLTLAGNADFNGNLDVDGITNLDVVDIDGNVQLDGTLTVGINDTGYDVKLFGATSGAYLLWDESADKLLTAGGTVIDIVKDKLLIGGTAVTTTAAELNILDGVTSTAAELNLLDGSSANTVVNSKAVIYGGSGEVAGTLSTAAQGNVTSLGTLTALTVDNLGVNGNTITANSGDLNLTPASGSAIVLDGTINVDAGVVTGATSITSTAFVGNVTGNASGTAATVTTAAQPNITSLGTLTALTVDDVAINGKVITMTGDTSDTAVITAGTNGTLSIVTTDAAAEAANITITADGTFEAGGTEITLNSAGDITLDAGGQDVRFKDDGTQFGRIAQSSSNCIVASSVSDKDLIFQGSDGGVVITALTLDMSEAGAATFNNKIVATELDISGDIDVDGITNLDVVNIDGAVDIDGAIDISNNLTLQGNLYLDVAADAWQSSTTWLNLADFGVLNTGGSYAVTLNGNGYRANDGEWTSLGAGSQIGATQIWMFPAGYITLNTDSDHQTGEATSVSERMRIAGDGNVGIGDNNPSEKLSVTGNVAITGSLSKGSGSFRIPHPIEAKSETHHLVHSFLEGPQADLLYRGKVDLVDGAATVNVDTASGMTDGTFTILCRDIQSFTTNESGWTAVRSSVSGNILTIEAQDATCTDSISWMVVGERQDKHMLDTGWTDSTGKVIVEPLITEKQEPPIYPDPEDDE